MRKNPSFALIYVLLFTTFIGMTVLITWSTGIAEIKLTRKGESISQAYQYALNAVEEGFKRYKQDLSGGLCESVFDYALFQENKARLLKEVTDNYTRSGSTVYGNARFKGEYGENHEVWRQAMTAQERANSELTPYELRGTPSVNIEGWLITENHIDHESAVGGYAANHYAAKYNTFYTNEEGDPGAGPFDLASQVIGYAIRESIDLPNLIYDTNPTGDPWDPSDKKNIWQAGNPIHTAATTYGASGGTITQMQAGVPVLKVSGGFYDGYLYLAGTDAEPIVIDGPVIIRNDLIIKGKIQGQGAIYVGENLYIADNIEYVNPPNFDLATYPYQTGAGIDVNTFETNIGTWVGANTNADMVGFLAQGNIVLGDITSDWMEQYYGVDYYDDEDGNPIEDWGILMGGPYGASGFWEGGGLSPLFGYGGGARASEDSGPDKVSATTGGDYNYVGYSDPTDSDALKQDYEDRDNDGLWRTDLIYSYQNDMQPSFDLVNNYGLPAGTTYSDIADFPARIDGFYLTEHMISGWILNVLDTTGNPTTSFEINGGLATQENAVFAIELGLPGVTAGIPVVTFADDIDDQQSGIEDEWPPLSFKIKYDHRFKGKYINIFEGLYLPPAASSGGGETTDLIVPAGADDPVNPRVLRYDIAGNLLQPVNQANPISNDAFDFRVINDVIYANGYSKGDKVSLWAKIGHDDVPIAGCPPIDHSKDFIIIYQGIP